MKTGSTVSKNGRRTTRREQEQPSDAQAASSVAARSPRAPKPAVKTSGSVKSELTAIPRLGPVRIQALAAAGVTTLAELRNRSVEDLGKVKWVGIGNARRIKAWLAAHDTAGDDGRLAADVAAAAASPAAAPGPREGAVPFPDDGTVPEGRVTVLSDSPEAGARPGGIDNALSRLKETVAGKARAKKLSKQLEKVETSVSAAPETIEKLPGRERQQAAKALDRISKVLADAAESGKLSDKKQAAIGADLKKARKRLEKALGS